MARTKLARNPRKVASSQPADSEATGASGGGVHSPSVPRSRRTPRHRPSVSPTVPPQRHRAAPSLAAADGGEASAFSASLSGAKRGRGEEEEDGEEAEGPAPNVKRCRRFRAPSPPAAPRPPLPVSLQDACAFVAAAGVAEAELGALQDALRDEEVDGETLCATTEEELRTVLGLQQAVSRRKLTLALRDATSPHAQPLPPPPTPWEVAAWLRRELGGAHGHAAADVAVRHGLDGRVLLSLSDAELSAVLGLSDAVQSRFGAIMAPLRCAAGAAACAPHGYLPSPLPARDSGTPAHHVVVLGDTGAGKSSLFNALVGERRLLPTSGMRACTATIVELSFNRGPDLSAEAAAQPLPLAVAASAAAPASPAAELYAPGQAYSPYVAVVEFLSATEWRAEVDAACAALGGGGGGKDAPLAEPEPDTPAHEAWCKVRAAYGTLPSSAAALRADASLAPLLGTAARLQAASAEEMYDALCPYADSVAAEAAGGRQLWPLVRRVRVAGPWAPLAAGAVLVDAPGVADSDAGRGGVVRACLRRADAVWLVANARRAVNDKTVKDALLRPFRRRLVAGAGRLGSVALIATQTDTLVRSEIADNLRLAPDASLAECAAARNEYTAARIEADFWAGVQDDDDAPGDDEEALPAAMPRGPREAVVRGPFTPPAALPSHCKWSNAALRRAATPASWAGWEPTPGMRGFVVHEFAEPRLDHPSPAFCVLQLGTRFAVFAASALAPVAAGVAAHPPQPPLPARYAFQFPVFCVSAYEFAKMSGLRPDDGAATTFPDVEATGVPALKRFLADSVAATAAAAAAAAAAHEAGKSSADASGDAALDDVPLLDVLRTEEAQLCAELRVFDAEIDAFDSPIEARSAAQRIVRELTTVRAHIATEERRTNPAAAAAAAGASGAPGVRAGALLLDCIAETREAAAAAEAACEDTKAEEVEAAKQPWTCAAVINAPISQPRSPGIPRDHPAYKRYGTEFARLLDTLNTQLVRGIPGHGAMAFDVPPQLMERFLEVIGHKGSITQHVLGMAVSVIPLSAKKVYLRRCAPEGPRSCGFVNKATADQAAPPGQCGRCGVARPPLCRLPDPRLLSVSTLGHGPFWTCLRPRHDDAERRSGETDAPPLRWRGTPRCGNLNTSRSRRCDRCDLTCLPCFSLPSSNCPATAAAVAAMSEEELRQLDSHELLEVIGRRNDHKVLSEHSWNRWYEFGARNPADIAFLAALVHGTNEVLAGRPRPPLPAPPDAQGPSLRLLPHHYGGLRQPPTTKAPEAAAPPAPMPPRFIAGPYAGAKPGYLHRSGPHGRGYYADDEVTDSDFFTKPASQPKKAAKKYVVDHSGAIDLTLSDDD